MTTNIHHMFAKDKPALMKILQNTPEFRPSELLVAEELIDSCLRDPHNSGYYTLVAEAGSSLLGYICYGPAPLTEATWDIYWMVVDIDKRGQGTGSALMEAAEKEITRAEGRIIIIETSSMVTYEKARSFYFSHGYEAIGCIHDFYAPGDDKLILQKRLR